MAPLATLPRALALAAFVTASAGCVFENYYDHHYGTVSLAWTINGTAEPSRCTATPIVHVVVRDDFDDVIADHHVACTALASRYVVLRGWYHASLTLLDASGRSVSFSRETGSFYVGARRDTYVRVDLPWVPPIVPLVPAEESLATDEPPIVRR
jgi:hypothetical protein